MVQEGINWIGEGYRIDKRKNQINYKSFRNEILNLEVEVGDYVLIRNEDSCQPENHEFCFIASVKRLYEKDSNKEIDLEDVIYYAEVQWYSRITDIPPNHQSLLIEPDYQQELLQDHRVIDSTLDLETIFSKCSVLFIDHDLSGSLFFEAFDSSGFPSFFCRWKYFGTENFIPVKDKESPFRKNLRTSGVKEAPNPPKPAMLARSLRRRTSQPNYCVSYDDFLIKPKVPKSAKKTSQNDKPIASTRKDTKRRQKVTAHDSDTDSSMEDENTDSPRQNFKRGSELQTDDIGNILFDADDENILTHSIRNRSKRSTRNAPTTPCKSTPVKKFYSPKKSPLVTPLKIILNNDKRNFTLTKLKHKIEDEADCQSTDSDVKPKKLKAQKKKTNLKLEKKTVATTTVKNKNISGTLKANPNIFPSYLPCRETEFDDINSFIEGKLLEETGGCMYISGVPGTGKTATIRRVLTYLKQRQEADLIPNFKLVEVNAMNLTAPHQCYVQILKQLNGKKSSPDQALQIIQKMFSSSSEAVVMVIDELDLLWTKRQDVMYSLFDWPNMINSKLVVLAIANTMDLPERLMMNRVSSRLGLTRKTFHPYTHQQLQEIVKSSMENEKLVYNADAMQLVSRKVAAVSGDARRALELWKRAKEIASEDEIKGNKCKMVELMHVDKAFQEMFCAPKILAIRYASVYEKNLLQAIVAEFMRTGLEESTFSPVFNQFLDFCRINDLPTINHSLVFELLDRLHSLSILLIEHGRSDILQKIRLNVSVDDVNYALRNN